MIAARTSGGPAYPEMIGEMGRELSTVIEDFDRAVYVEALRLANETSKLSLSQNFDSRSSGVWRRATGARTKRTRTSGGRAKRTRASGTGASRAGASRASRARASKAGASRAGAHRAGASRARASRARAFIQASYACQDGPSRQTPLYGRHPPNSSQENQEMGGARGHFPEECILALRLTRHRKNLASPFNLRKPSQAKPPCWCFLLPEG